MSTISIEPAAVDGTAATLQQGAQSINDGGHAARRRLHHLDGIPAKFHDDATRLGAQVGRVGYHACDALAVSGLELSRRAEIARIVDAQPFAGGSQNPHTSAGARQDLGLWNEATQTSSRSKPGALFDEIGAALKHVAAAGVVAAAPVTTGAPAAPTVRGKGKGGNPRSSGLNLWDERTGSLVTLEQAIRAADTSGTGVAIAVGKSGQLFISKQKP